MTDTPRATPSAPTITLPAPKALLHDLVLVCNYRRNEMAETGEVCGVECHEMRAGEWRWRYVVTLDRLSASGRFLHLTVGDDRILEVRKPEFAEANSVR